MSRPTGLGARSDALVAGSTPRTDRHHHVQRSCVLADDFFSAPNLNAPNVCNRCSRRRTEAGQGLRFGRKRVARWMRIAASRASATAGRAATGDISRRIVGWSIADFLGREGHDRGTRAGRAWRTRRRGGPWASEVMTFDPIAGQFRCQHSQMENRSAGTRSRSTRRIGDGGSSGWSDLVVARPVRRVHGRARGRGGGGRRCGGDRRGPNRARHHRPPEAPGPVGASGGARSQDRRLRGERPQRVVRHDSDRPRVRHDSAAAG